MQDRVELCVYSKYSPSKGSLVDLSLLINQCENAFVKCIAVTDYNSVEVYHTLEKTLKSKKLNDFKIIYGLSTNVNYKGKNTPISILVKNNLGLKSIYKLVSRIKDEAVCMRDIMEFKDNILVGLKSRDVSLLENFRDLANYVEVNSSYDGEEIVNILREAKRLNVKVVAVNEVNSLGNDSEARKCIESNNSFIENFVNSEVHTLKNTKEMMEEYDFLSLDERKEIIIDNPNYISSLISNVSIKQDRLFLPLEYKELKSVCYEKAREIYGEVPSFVKSRIDYEISIIDRNNMSGFVKLLRDIKGIANESNALIEIRTSLINSYVLYLMGVSEINPLHPHYVCKYCHKVIMSDDISGYGCCLSDKVCCNDLMVKTGFNLTRDFLDKKHENAPVINVKVSNSFIDKFVSKMNERFNLVKAGEVWLVDESLARRKVKHGKKEVISDLIGIKREDNNFYNGYFFLFSNVDIFDVTPLRCDKTHYDYKDLSNLVRINIGTNESLNFLEELVKNSNWPLEFIRLDNENVINLFSSESNLGVNDVQLLCNHGGAGILYEGIPFGYETIYDIVKYISYYHINNRDMIYNYFCSIKVPKDEIFKILDGNYSEYLKLLPNSLLNSVLDNPIFYSEEYIISLVIKCYRILYFKLAHARVYYYTYLCRYKKNIPDLDEYDYDTLRNRIFLLEDVNINGEVPIPRELYLDELEEVDVLQVMLEAVLRGIKIERVKSKKNMIEINKNIITIYK